MTQMIKVALAGAGAFGLKHLDGIKEIDGIEVVSLVGRERDKTQEAAEKYGVGHATTDLSRQLEAGRSRRRHPRDADPDARRPGACNASKRASTCRSRSPSPTA